MDERKEFALRRLLLNLLGKPGAHTEVQASLSSVNGGTPGFLDTTFSRRDNRVRPKRVRKISSSQESL
jgi:hypothetical protein